MNGPSSLIDGSKAFSSEEFRQFAIKWLGFDPLIGNRLYHAQAVTIELRMDQLPKFTIESFAVVRDPVRPPFEPQEVDQ